MARLQSGDALIVLGAGGGVGLAAVQLGVQLGADVTAVASSTEKLDVAAAYGAQRLINHRAGDLRAALRDALPDGADAVVDPVGGELSEPALRSLRRGGRFVTIGYASGVIPRIPLNLVLVKGVHVLGFQFQDVPPDEFERNEDELRDLLATGTGVTSYRRGLSACRDVAGAASCRRRKGGRQGTHRPRVVANGIQQALSTLLLEFRCEPQIAGTRSAATDGVAITPQRNVSVSPTSSASRSWRPSTPGP